MKRSGGIKRKVRQLDLVTGEEIKVYESITAAADDNYLTFETLSKALRKQSGILRYKKLKFEYV